LIIPGQRINQKAGMTKTLIAKAISVEMYAALYHPLRLQAIMERTIEIHPEKKAP